MAFSLGVFVDVPAGLNCFGLASSMRNEAASNQVNLAVRMPKLLSNQADNPFEAALFLFGIGIGVLADNGLNAGDSMVFPNADRASIGIEFEFFPGTNRSEL